MTRGVGKTFAKTQVKTVIEDIVEVIEITHYVGPRSKIKEQAPEPNQSSSKATPDGVWSQYETVGPFSHTPQGGPMIRIFGTLQKQ